MTDFLYTDARWTEHFVEVSDPHKEGHHVRFYFERPWVGLTDEEIDRYFDEQWGGYSSYHDCFKEVMRWQEAKLKEKNNG